MRFDRAYSVSSWTLPAIASLFTGLLPSRHGANDRGLTLTDDALTLAELLQARGYRTAAFSANFSYVQPSDTYPQPPLNLGQGFDSFHVGWQLADESDREAEVIRDHYVRTVRAPTLGEQVEKLVAETSTPFFGFVLFIDPHYGYEPPPEYVQMFATPGIESRLTGYMRDFPQLIEPLSADDLTFLRDRYDGEIRITDDAIGSILKSLEKRGILDQTMIIVLSDHGEEINDHGRMLHAQALYEESVRVPLIFTGPNIPAGVTVDEPVSITDVMPTILATARAQIPTGLDGRDLALLWRPGLRNALRRWWQAGSWPVIMELDNEQVTLNGPRPHQRAVVRGRWKLIVSPQGQVELFDLEADPRETNNLASDNSAVVQQLQSILAAHAKSAPEPRARPTLSQQDKERLRALGYAAE